MEKINVAELLRNCPSGMELDCTMFEGVEFDGIVDNKYTPIRCRIKNPDGGYNVYFFTKHGYWNDDCKAKCVIFPKGKTSWEGFVPPCQFKDGDVVAFDIEEDSQLFIFKEYIHNHDYAKGAKCYMMLDCCGEIDFEGGDYYVERFATEEEKETLFDSIKAHGYKWNPETKTLEELPKFKVGDTVRHKNTKTAITITGIKDNYYLIQFYNSNKNDYQNEKVSFNDQDKYELVLNKLVEPKFKVGDKIVKKNSVCVPILITKVGDEFYYSNTESSVGVMSISDQDEYELVPVKSKFKVGDRIVHKKEGNPFTITEITDGCYKGGTRYAILITQQDNFELVSDKFDINTLVPYESRVLVRNDKDQYWIPAFWGCKHKDGYTTTFGWCKYCIPHEGNEHLLETNNDCKEYFKTWK